MKVKYGIETLNGNQFYVVSAKGYYNSASRAMVLEEFMYVDRHKLQGKATGFDSINLMQCREVEVRDVCVEQYLNGWSQAVFKFFVNYTGRKLVEVGVKVQGADQVAVAPGKLVVLAFNPDEAKQVQECYPGMKVVFSQAQGPYTVDELVGILVKGPGRDEEPGLESRLTSVVEGTLARFREEAASLRTQVRDGLEQCLDESVKASGKVDKLATSTRKAVEDLLSGVPVTRKEYDALSSSLANVRTLLDSVRTTADRSLSLAKKAGDFDMDKKLRQEMGKVHDKFAKLETKYSGKFDSFEKRVVSNVKACIMGLASSVDGAVFCTNANQELIISVIQGIYEMIDALGELLSDAKPLSSVKDAFKCHLSTKTVEILKSKDKGSKKK